MFNTGDEAYLCMFITFIIKQRLQPFMAGGKGGGGGGKYLYLWRSDTLCMDLYHASVHKLWIVD